jgi:signal transduction histidine kinase
VASDVDRTFRAAAAHLDDATAAIATRPAHPPPLGLEQRRARTYFEIAASVRHSQPDIDAVSIFDATGRPIAWSGRPSSLPDERINGPAALFVAPGPFGLRLVHVRPIMGTGRETLRLGSVAAEHLLTRDAVGRAGSHADFTLSTSLVPVSLRLRYEGGGESVSPYGFLLGRPDQPPLVEAEVAPEDLRALRLAWRGKVEGAALAMLALTLLGVAVLAREDQERSTTRARYLRYTGGLLLLLVGARLLLALAIPDTWLLKPSAPMAERLVVRSPADFVATALLFLVLVALAGDLVERWRLTSRQPEPRGPIGEAAFWTANVLVAAIIGVLLAWHEHVLAAVVRESGAFGIQFSIRPLSSDRLALVVGTVLINAATFWCAVVLVRLATTRWRVRRRALARRAALAAIYVSVPLATLWAETIRHSVDHAVPFVPAVGAAVFAGALARWVLPRFRHASQALRLVVGYLALLIPSLAFYPVIVALEDTALGDKISAEYTPEVLNHRSELRVLLRRSLDELDNVPVLAEQFAVDPEVRVGPPDADRAYFLWSQTELGRQRLTSSVEVYAPGGGLVSRFALNLPTEFLASDRPVEAGCAWDVFGEALASTDEQVLLHAGRALCERDARGAVHRIGVLLVHVVLDYGTLPFVAAQDPYASLFRPTLHAAERTFGREVGFAVYGWGRTPVYPTAGTAWPISQELLLRLFRADRQPFWAELSRGDRRYQVFLSNDRAGIYAIGYEVPRPLDHGVAMAEIGTLSAATFVLLLVALGVLGRLSGRHPMTGRALLREIRQSFYRKLFLLFVAASVVPVLALAFVTRAYVAAQLREGLEASALRTASAARRVIETVVSQQRRDRSDPAILTDDIMVSVSRIIDQDVNVFVNSSLIATSQRDLFASGLLPIRTPAEVARAITLERQASYVGDERLGLLQYTVAAVPVRDGEAGAILTVPLTLRQQEIEDEIDALDRRVTLAAMLFIALGAAIGYFTAERIADPVNRLTRASRRIARGDLDARIHIATADELRRLVEAFNQMAADLKRQRGELERTNRLAAWADMARQVAHDIKNPLTPIQLSAEHLRRVHQDAGAPLGAVLDSCIETILSQVTLLRRIASEFSSFASSPVARLAPTRLHEVIEEVVAPYRTGLPDNVRLEVHEASNVPVLQVDRGLLGRALVNVIENALHAMRGGGTLTVATRPADGGAAIEIEDSGVGMDPDALERLFEPYFSTKATGTGLGLTIAKRNVELNGGEISVSSEKGRGTTVTITLPPPPAASAAGG